MPLKQKYEKTIKIFIDPSLTNDQEKSFGKKKLNDPSLIRSDPSDFFGKKNETTPVLY